MVKADDERLQPEFLDQVIQRPGAVLAAAEGNDAIVVVPASVGCDESVEVRFSRRPVDARLLVLVLPADVADPGGVEHDRLVGLRSDASGATNEIAHTWPPEPCSRGDSPSRSQLSGVPLGTSREARRPSTCSRWRVWSP